MNDLFYEIIMQSSILITGFAMDKQNLLYNLFLTIFGLFELPELHIFDLAGQSSNYGRFSPAIYAPSDILDTLSNIHGDMCARIGGTADTSKPVFLYIHNFDSVINQFYGKEKKEVMRLVSDIVNRGSSANIHIIVSAEKYNNPLFNDFASRIIAGKCDKKTAVKYFGALAQDLTAFDCSDFGQCLSKIDKIYRINVPGISETALDSIMQELTGSADDTPTIHQNAPTARPAKITVNSHAKRTERTETATQAEIQASAQHTSQADSQNFVAIILSAIIGLFAGILDSISNIITDNAIIKFAVLLVSAVLCIVMIPIKLIYVVVSAFGDFPAVCMIYMLVCTAAGLMV